jgi:hypothetical protein
MPGATEPEEGVRRAPQQQAASHGSFCLNMLARVSIVTLLTPSSGLRTEEQLA